MLALARSSSSCSSTPSSSNATACSSRSPTHSPQRPRFPPPTAPPCRSTNDRESKLDWSSRGRGALRCTPASRSRPTCRSPVQSLGRRLHLPWPAPMKTAAAATTTPRSTVFRAAPSAPRPDPPPAKRLLPSTPPSASGASTRRRRHRLLDRWLWYHVEVWKI